MCILILILTHIPIHMCIAISMCMCVGIYILTLIFKKLAMFFRISKSYFYTVKILISKLWVMGKLIMCPCELKFATVDEFNSLCRGFIHLYVLKSILRYSVRYFESVTLYPSAFMTESPDIRL